MERKRDQRVTLLVNWTCSLAEIDLGSELDMVSVYRSENLGSFEETISPVLVKDPCIERLQHKITNDLKRFSMHAVSESIGEVVKFKQIAQNS